MVKPRNENVLFFNKRRRAGKTTRVHLLLTLSILPCWTFGLFTSQNNSFFIQPKANPPARAPSFSTSCQLSAGEAHSLTRVQSRLSRCPSWEIVTLRWPNFCLSCVLCCSAAHFQREYYMSSHGGAVPTPANKLPTKMVLTKILQIITINVRPSSLLSFSQH